MDQMTSALGGAGQLLALLCQPAEVQGHVEIPHQVGGGQWWAAAVVTQSRRALILQPQYPPLDLIHRPTT
jgi:hypothetical protein